MTGILIIARLGSTRLENKHLIKIGNKTFIEWLVYRFISKFQKLIEEDEIKIIIATSLREENKRFSEIFTASGVEIFYGSDENIPLRQLQCAEHFNLTNIISIDGDDILCSVKGAEEVLQLLRIESMAIKTTGLPLGMNSMGYKVSYLKERLSEFYSSSKFETGWGRIFESTITNLKLGNMGEDIRLRFTLDYEQDAMFFEKILIHFGEKIGTVSDNNIIKYVIENKIYEVNQALNEEYWNNFNNLKKAEL